MLNKTGKICGRNGFTLLELLVVVGIIALLAGALLPALSKAREMGRKIKCVSNLKQIGTALWMYAQDNGEYFPTPYDSSGTIGVDRYWFDLLKDYVKADFGSSSPRYSNTVYECPTDRYRTSQTVYTSYIYATIFWTNYSTQTCNTVRISNTSEIGIVTDGRSSMASPSQIVADVEGGTDTSKRLRPRHSGGANILFCDGHVESKMVDYDESLQTLFEVP